MVQTVRAFRMLDARVMRADEEGCLRELTLLETLADENLRKLINELNDGSLRGLSSYHEAKRDNFFAELISLSNVGEDEVNNLVKEHMWRTCTTELRLRSAARPP